MINSAQDSDYEEMCSNHHLEIPEYYNFGFDVIEKRARDEIIQKLAERVDTEEEGKGRKDLKGKINGKVDIHATMALKDKVKQKFNFFDIKQLD